MCCSLPASHGNWTDCAAKPAPRKYDGALQIEHGDMLIERLAERLLDEAIVSGNHEAKEDGMWVHGAKCQGFCDYACGAIWIGVQVDHDGQRTITEVESGNLRVRLT